MLEHLTTFCRNFIDNLENGKMLPNAKNLKKLAKKAGPARVQYVAVSNALVARLRALVRGFRGARVRPAVAVPAAGREREARERAAQPELGCAGFRFSSLYMTLCNFIFILQRATYHRYFDKLAAFFVI